VQELAEKLPMNDFNQGRFEGNPGLKPAFIDTFELGVEASMAVGRTRCACAATASPTLPPTEHGGGRHRKRHPLKNRPGRQRLRRRGRLRFEFSSGPTPSSTTLLPRLRLAAPEGFQYLTDVPSPHQLGRADPHRQVGELRGAGAGRRRARNNGAASWRCCATTRSAYLLFGAQLRTDPIFDTWTSPRRPEHHQLRPQGRRAAADAGRMTGSCRARAQRET
jgi:hypothetical protein